MTGNVQGKAKPGKFVWIGSGIVFDGFEENDRVSEVITQAGHLPKNRRAPFLPYWSRYGSTDAVSNSNVAHYDPAVEAAASDLRNQIDFLRAQLETVQRQLAGLYDYQAGPRSESH